ncbi:MAG: TIGR01244 family sulfur transferase [Hyphomonadaceae bacterium]
MTQFIPVAPGFSVAPQLKAEDFAAAGRAGFKLIVNNRPDGEAPDQLAGAAAAAAAASAGLAYQAIPVSGQPNAAAIDAMAAALDNAEGPLLSYCRSGTRSITLWALAEAQRKKRAPDDLIALAKAAGYDLSRLKPTLDALAQG